MSKGIDTIALVSVNDAFVLDAWSKSLGAQAKILMLADGSAYFTKVWGVKCGGRTASRGLSWESTCVAHVARAEAL